MSTEASNLGLSIVLAITVLALTFSSVCMSQDIDQLQEAQQRTCAEVYANDAAAYEQCTD